MTEAPRRERNATLPYGDQHDDGDADDGRSKQRYSPTSSSRPRECMPTESKNAITRRRDYLCLCTRVYFTAAYLLLMLKFNAKLC